MFINIMFMTRGIFLFFDLGSWVEKVIKLTPKSWLFIMRQFLISSNSHLLFILCCMVVLGYLLTH